MTPDSAKKLWADRLVEASSALLAASWVAYLAYISVTHIDKQSVYLGPITFFSAILFAITVVSLLVLLSAWGSLIYRRHSTWRRSTYLLVGVVVWILAVHQLTEAMIRRAIGS